MGSGASHHNLKVKDSNQEKKEEMETNQFEKKAPGTISLVDEIIHLINDSSTKLSDHEKVRQLLEELKIELVAERKAKQKSGNDPKSRMTLQKLSHLTGREDSVLQLKEYISPATPEEAKEVRTKIEHSDRMKKVFGKRPDTTGGKDLTR